MSKNLMIRYVFESNSPNVLQKMVSKYGVSPAQNQNDLWRKLNYVLKTFPQDAFRDIVAIHPDKDIIMKLSGAGVPSPLYSKSDNKITSESPISKEAIEKLQGNVAQTETKTEVADKKSNACGCGDKTSGCGGETSETSGCDGGKCSCGGKCGGKKSSETELVPAKTPTAYGADASTESVSSFKKHLPLVLSVAAIVGICYLISKK